MLHRSSNQHWDELIGTRATILKVVARWRPTTSDAHHSRLPKGKMSLLIRDLTCTRAMWYADGARVDFRQNESGRDWKRTNPSPEAYLEQSRLEWCLAKLGKAWKRRSNMIGRYGTWLAAWPPQRDVEIRQHLKIALDWVSSNCVCVAVVGNLAMSH